MLEIVCGSKPEELEEMDVISVNGVKFVPMSRYDGTKGMLVGYVEDARKMVRDREALIKDMLLTINWTMNGAKVSHGKYQEYYDRTFEELGIKI